MKAMFITPKFPGLQRNNGVIASTILIMWENTKDNEIQSMNTLGRRKNPLM